MADLWKNGDIITADKLNKIVFCEYTYQINNPEGTSITYTLDLTPEDIFD